MPVLKRSASFIASTICFIFFLCSPAQATVIERGFNVEVTEGILVGIRPNNRKGGGTLVCRDTALT